jgi:hypothetical protein
MAGVVPFKPPFVVGTGSLNSGTGSGFGPLLSPPRPGTNWADWSDAMGREMYLRRALDRLNFEYPSDDAS